VLPDQNVEGIKICGMSMLTIFTVLLYLFTVHSLNDLVGSQEGVEYVLTEWFNQEGLYGQQRSRGCRNDNPSVNQFLENTQALIVQKSLAYGGSSNISKKRKSAVLSLSPLSRPLPKHRCKRLFL